MTELSQMCRAARESERHQEPIWLATVMRVKGSAYRQPGARMLFSSDRVLAGSLSGGCLEASIARKGPWLARERPSCVRFEGGAEEDDELPRGTGCDGIVDILLERASFALPTAPLSIFEDCLRRERRAILATVFTSRDALAPVGARLSLDEDGKIAADSLSGATWAALARAAERVLTEPNPRPRLVTSERCEALLEIIEPPPHLFVFGAGPDALPVVQLATAVGLAVTVYDTSSRVPVRDRFAGVAEVRVGSVEDAAALIAARRRPIAVVMSHHYPTDRQALEVLLASKTPYIGVLGPLRRTERMLHELYPDPSRLTARERSRVRAPLGLDLGAETPAQIALSAISEIQAVLAQRSALPLSQRGARPIHPAVTELSLPALTEFDQTGTA